MQTMNQPMIQAGSTIGRAEELSFRDNHFDQTINDID